MREALTAAASRRVARPAPLRQAVYDALTELIINGSLKPGQHLVEAELAEHLGVSRQPVREALQRLQTAGWVDLRPAQGAFVHSPTEEEAAQLLGVRSVLETYSAQLAAQNAQPEDIERLGELQQEGVDALAEGDVERLVAANTALHAFVTSVAANDVLAELLAQVGQKVRWYYTPIAKPRGKEAWNEHIQLIKAIAKGDADRAGEVMRKHTERTSDFYRKQIASGSSQD
ncbi:GntR family transcriptional regulator [Streptomyces sp. NBC_00140]|uniref:GntR family transcriptional regulator n=1 Tax=Streptomyces sp. NBC_00140 TaxID=2975664 RepID=UPI0022592690|nr:GntR family transcriptional regulator [Streptomyces sp. NBC_00140]MCX5330162.1 GntR family transcriptional regulator [Streptomyces sp. NBC_00140]